MVLTVCSTAMAEVLNDESAVGTIGTLNGREAMVVDLGGSIGKVAIALENVGAIAEDAFGTRFSTTSGAPNFYDPETYKLEDGWYVPSQDELSALKSLLAWKSDNSAVYYTNHSDLQFPLRKYEQSYYGYYVTSTTSVSGTYTDYAYLYIAYGDGSGTRSISMSEGHNQSDCAIRPFHKLPTKNQFLFYTSSDNKVVTPSDDAFNVSIVSNDYKDGQGVITFSGELTSIGDWAFNEISTLTSISIPASVTSIGDHAFNYTNITAVTIPASVTTIGDYAFSYTNITAVTIPASVTTIGDEAFSNCSGLNTLTFADGSHLETIGESAFSGTALSGTLNLPASLISIGEAAFATTKITAVTIPASVTSIEKYAFSGCSQLSSLTFADGSQLETIKDEAFKNTAIEGVLTLPASLTSIGWAAFGATKITAVNFPVSVTTIGQQAFDGCSNLATLNFADGSQLETIGIKAFIRTALSGNLDNLPASLKSIGVKAFSELAITAVTIPASVTTIEDEAFLLCNSLATLTFADNSQLKTIGNNAFKGTAISGELNNLPASLESIGNAAFNGLAITGVVIPASVTTIGDYAFSGCSSLAALSFADGSQLKTIGKEAFKGTAIAGKLDYLPASLESIGYGVFSELAITSVTFPESLKSIGEYAFSGTSLSGDLTIPASVTTIGELPFGGTQISNVYMSTEDLTNISIKAFYSNIVIFVPANLYEAYKEKFTNNKVEVPLEEWKLCKIGQIEAAIKTVNTLSPTDKATIEGYITDIRDAESFDTINEIYDAVLPLIDKQKAFEEKVKGVFNTLGTKQDGPAIEIVGKDGQTIKLYNIEKVNFIKVKVEE